MNFVTDTPLSTLTTMRLGGPARRVVTVTSRDELVEAIAEARSDSSEWFVLGDGSNVIATDEGFNGTIILNRIKQYDVLTDDEQGTTLQIGAGENWDETVARTVDAGLTGIEAMSAIPGTAGATPVQNVGAYGQEIADTLVELEAYDTTSGSFVTLRNEDCHFTYRNSLFKDPATRHHVIVSITLRLKNGSMKPPFYGSLQSYLEQHNITDFSPLSVRNAVIEIRRNKLPDPKRVANTGSFFKNPIVSKHVAERLQMQFNEMPSFPMVNGDVKLAAGWLIEHAGLKNYAHYGMKTYEHNALVVVNEAATSYKDLATFKAEIIAAVAEKFGITLEQEPETLVPTGRLVAEN